MPSAFGYSLLLLSGIVLKAAAVTTDWREHPSSLVDAPRVPDWKRLTLATQMLLLNTVMQAIMYRFVPSATNRLLVNFTAGNLFNLVFHTV